MSDSFIGNIVHELRSPLAIAQGFAEVITSKPDISVEQAREYGGKIVKACQRLTETLEALLLLEKIEKTEAFEERCNLQQVLREVKEEASELYKEETIEIDLLGEPLFIQGNSILLRLALMNLLQNGVRYSSQTAHIVIRAFAWGEEIVVQVADHGIGIAVQDFPCIFQRFVVLDKASSKKHGGLGIGLSIVRSIVNKHRGTISVESTIGKGTVFTLHFPKLKEEARLPLV